MNNLHEIQRALGPIPLGPVVGGKPLDGDGVIPVVDPATEEVITESANGTVNEALTAVGVAHQAQDAWAEISPRARSEILRRAFDLMTERAVGFSGHGFKVASSLGAVAADLALTGSTKTVASFMCPSRFLPERQTLSALPLA